MELRHADLALFQNHKSPITSIHLLLRRCSRCSHFEMNTDRHRTPADMSATTMTLNQYIHAAILEKYNAVYEQSRQQPNCNFYDLTVLAEFRSADRVTWRTLQRRQSHRPRSVRLLVRRCRRCSRCLHCETSTVRHGSPADTMSATAYFLRFTL